MQEEHLILVHELCIYHNVELKFIHSLQEHGLIKLTNVEEKSFIPFSQLLELEKMIRLHYDLDVNVEGIDVIHHLVKKLEDAQNEIGRLKIRLKFYGEMD